MESSGVSIFVFFALSIAVAIFAAGWAMARRFPLLRKGLRVLGYVYLTLVIPLYFYIAYELSYFPPFTRSPQVFLQGESSHGKFMVVGTSAAPFEWEITLYWRPPGKPWAEYFLDGDGYYWTNFCMIESGDNLTVQFPYGYDGATLNLDLQTGLARRWKDSSFDKPMLLYLSADPLSAEASWIDNDSKGWPEKWAEFQHGLSPKQ